MGADRTEAGQAGAGVPNRGWLGTLTGPLVVFLVCAGVVALSVAVVLAVADSWLHEPGAELFGARPIFLIGIVVLLEAPVLAAVSAHYLHEAAGFLGTVAGAPALFWLEHPSAEVLGLFVLAGVLALPVFAEFWIVRALRRLRGRR